MSDSGDRPQQSAQAPVPGPPAERRPRKRATVIVVGAVIALLVLGSVGAIVVLPRFASFTHQGAPSDIPLPPNSTFVELGKDSTTGGRAWFYTVTGTNSVQVASFYNAQLPATGWTNVNASPGVLTASDGTIIDRFALIYACKNGTELLANADEASQGDVRAPSNGVALEIALSAPSNSGGVTVVCG